MTDTLNIVASRFEVVRNGAATEYNLAAVGDSYPTVTMTADGEIIETIEGTPIYFEIHTPKSNWENVKAVVFLEKISGYLCRSAVGIQGKRKWFKSSKGTLSYNEYRENQKNINIFIRLIYMQCTI